MLVISRVVSVLAAVGAVIVLAGLIGSSQAQAAKTEGVPAIVSSPQSGGTYSAGETIQVQVGFNRAVTVDTTGGTPWMWIAIGHHNRRAAYASGSGSANLVFSYTVATHDLDTDGIGIPKARIMLDGGSIVDAGSGNDARREIRELADQSGHKVRGWVSVDAEGVALQGQQGGTPGSVAMPTVTLYVEGNSPSNPLRYYGRDSDGNSHLARVRARLSHSVGYPVRIDLTIEAASRDNCRLRNKNGYYNGKNPKHLFINAGVLDNEYSDGGPGGAFHNNLPEVYVEAIGSAGSCHVTIDEVYKGRLTAKGIVKWMSRSKAANRPDVTITSRSVLVHLTSDLFCRNRNQGVGRCLDND